MLEDHGVGYEYRDYRKDPLSEGELRELLVLLDARPADVLRKRDRAYRELSLTGDEPDGVLLSHMAAHPTLLARPIGRTADRAVIGRPIENLLDLVHD